MKDNKKIDIDKWINREIGCKNHKLARSIRSPYLETRCLDCDWHISSELDPRLQRFDKLSKEKKTDLAIELAQKGYFEVSEQNKKALADNNFHCWRQLKKMGYGTIDQIAKKCVMWAQQEAEGKPFTY